MCIRDRCGGVAVEDDCGICSGGLTGHLANIDKDCNGDCNGDAYYDPNCGNGMSCIGGNTGLEACVQDCAGNWGGVTVDDECGVCGGDNSSCMDCAGTPNGDAEIDNCGICS